MGSIRECHSYGKCNGDVFVVDFFAWFRGSCMGGLQTV